MCWADQALRAPCARGTRRIGRRSNCQHYQAISDARSSASSRRPIAVPRARGGRTFRPPRESLLRAKNSLRVPCSGQKNSLLLRLGNFGRHEIARWCRLRDSNPRPTVYKTVALPTELNRRCSARSWLPAASSPRKARPISGRPGPSASMGPRPRPPRPCPATAEW